MKKVFIDAGHNYSGWNTGAVGNGMREQDITFEVAKLTGVHLSNAGFDVKLSRPTLETNLGQDNSSSINARWQKSNTWGADYFISIHVNAGGGTGAETLYHSEDSLEMATIMQNVYSKAMGLRNRRVWKRDDVGVLRWSSCPSILIELAFIDSLPPNPDVRILREQRPQMAAAVAEGFLSYAQVDLGGGDVLPPERFNNLDEMPDWARPTIEKLLKSGFLRGDGQGLDLSLDMLRIFVVHDRAGVYDTIAVPI